MNNKSFKRILFTWLFLLNFLLLSISYADFSTLAVYSDPVPGQATIKIAVGNWILPDVPPKGYYRVKMVRSEICNTDRRILGGTKTSAVAEKKIVLGHEGIGRIYQLPQGGSAGSDLKIGDLVLLAPHYVEKDDPMLLKGLPNLSPKMKHLGIHINGVFANYMDFPQYNIIKIPEAEDFPAKTAQQDSYYDQMVMIEPLACVQRGYKLIEKQDYFKNNQINTVLIMGGGPMGVIHAIHLQYQYPQVKTYLYDPDPIRRNLARNISLMKAQILDQLDPTEKYDLVVVANSSRTANSVDAVNLIKNNGIILLFSGIDMKEGESHPLVGAVDIEDVHRYEGSVRLMNYEVNGINKSIYFVGTSGYTKNDIETSIKELHKDFLLGKNSVYKEVSTTMILKLDGKTAFDLTKKFHNLTFDTPAIIPLLTLYQDNTKDDYNVHHHLKIIIKHQ